MPRRTFSAEFKAEVVKLVVNSDQCSIYGSNDFTECVSKHRVVQSMPRRGNCWYNGPMEAVLNRNG